MGRLIDEDVLLKAMDKRYKEKHGNVPDNLAEGFMQMEKLIKEQPTAYDTEKVIEQLEERMYDSKNAQATAGISMRIANANYHHGKADAFNKAIDIVRKGGAE